MTLADVNYILGKARETVVNGKNSWELQDVIMKLTIALILNEPMWIMEIGYSMAQAIDTIGMERCSVLYAIEQILSREITSG